MVLHVVSEDTEEMWRIEKAWYFPGAFEREKNKVQRMVRSQYPVTK